MDGTIKLTGRISINPQIIETAKGKVEADVSGGQTRPAVLCMHGGCGGVDQGRLLLAWLDPAEYRLISPSRPGYLGTPLESGRSMEEQADLMAALLDKLKIEKAAVIGASSGGPPAYTFALRHPGRTACLVAIDAVSGYYDIPEKAGPLVQAFFLSDLGQKLAQYMVDFFPKSYLRELFRTEGYFTPAQLERHVAYVLREPGLMEYAQAVARSMNPYSTRKAGTENDIAIYRAYTHLPLERITAPSLIVHGTHDADVKMYDGVYAHEHIAGSERFWIEEGSHFSFFMSENGRNAQRAAREFIKKHLG